MKKLKWNRFCTIFVLLMFLTVTYASFNTNLFINGKGYVRVEEGIRITNIKLLSVENDGYETYESEFSKNSVTMDVNLPKQNSTMTYQVMIQNTFPYDYDVKEILEETYSNKDVKYELVGIEQNTLIEKNSTKTFTIKFSNNATITPEDDIYETKEYTFDYTGGEQEFIAPYDGEYTLEVWGAEGGTHLEGRGGFGGYSKGTILLNKNEKIYVNVGGQGKKYTEGDTKGGYNGGGDTGKASSGGGATHIAKVKGVLSTLEKYKSNILIVAGGGGGGERNAAGEGGGYKGTNGHYSENYSSYGEGGTQESGGIGHPKNGNTPYDNINGSFGKGGSGRSSDSAGGGGGGFYGGGGATYASSGGGGSGYIGNAALTNKAMYCYYCEESSEVNTKTISTTNVSETPTSNYAKKGNGYAKITLTRKIVDGTDFDFNYTGGEQTFTTPYTGIYKLETWGAQGGNLPKNPDIGAGYGGYSTGQIYLTKNSKIYINVGGQGSRGTASGTSNRIGGSGGYNGGGSGGKAATNGFNSGSGGGGATHIALETGLLSTFENKVNKLLIVSGGGGGACHTPKLFGGHGGGAKGTINIRTDGNDDQGYPVNAPGTQTSGYKFGIGQNGADATGGGNGCEGNGGSGGGFYGGTATTKTGEKSNAAGSGGSGYIGNTQLTEKVMYCYNCEESSEVNTKTVTTQAHSEMPKQFQAKEGNGYSRITLAKRQANNAKLTLKFKFERHLYDYTITYNYNYMKNNEFFTDYQSNITKCCGTKADENLYTFITQVDENGRTYIGEKTAECTGEQQGFYFGGRKKDPLINDTQYDISFEAKANTNFVIRAGPEQTAGNVVKNYNITPEWKKYGTTITAKTNGSYYAFIVYDWAKAGFHRKLEIRNLSIQPKPNDYEYEKIKATETKPIETNIAPDPTREGWKFVGWYDDPIAGEKITLETIMPSQNVTYYAHWKLQNYSIHYNLDGGTIEGTKESYYHEDNDITLPTPTKEGYTFAGWTGGKNLLPPSSDWELNDIYLDSGQNKDNAAYIRTKDYINVKASTDYYLNYEGDYCSNIIQYDENKQLISSNLSELNCNQRTFKTSDNTKYLRIDIRKNPAVSPNNTSIIDSSKFQLEEGTAPTSYEQNTIAKTKIIPYHSLGNREYNAIWTPKVAKINTGENVNVIMKTVAGHTTATHDTEDASIINIKHSYTIPDDVSESYKISTEDSEYPVYVYKKDNVLYWCSEASRFVLNSDSSYLFNYFSGVTQLDITKNFDTSFVTNMHQMFAELYNLQRLDLSNFNTSNVTSTFAMFYRARSITYLNVSSFDTSKVTNMRSMFNECIALEELDISSFSFQSVTTITRLFLTCGNLKKIYVSASLSIPENCEGEEVFLYCGSLVGESGTIYNIDKVDKTYARIDGGAPSPGYFTSK